ncbi:MAG: ABC transporter substrate-binding protein [Gemmataceae bacterium]|nr:ABC transporter substrate-binding protein [Gemmataceae bacterium]
MSGDGTIEPVRFNAFPELKESFLTGSLEATFILAPMAMKLREEGHPVKIVHLGHRDGTAMMVHKDSPIRRIEDLRPGPDGKKKKVAIPSRLSNQFLILFKAFSERGMDVRDIEFQDVPPPEMPIRLQQKQVDAIIAGEPLMAKTEIEGYGRVLFLTKDVWPEFISCVLAVKESTIRDKRARVQELVDGIARSGLWLDQDKADPSGGNHRMQAAEFVGPQYYGQDPKLLRFVLSKPVDRVKYTNLSVREKDFDEIAKWFKQASPFMRPHDRFKGEAGFKDYCDPSFLAEDRKLEAYKWQKPK